eukprot:TRINITY_DN4007_c0_g1_i3.p1 TRINITY_DN4007_c0_g1~~TRINITY_DN4007_c0_g1_i3.p1  ORF type:complete len:685 (-),score=234.94 TRINITY_DN4007_c0_g1_i3:566-2458(-)
MDEEIAKTMGDEEDDLINVDGGIMDEDQEMMNTYNDILEANSRRPQQVGVGATAWTADDDPSNDFADDISGLLEINSILPPSSDLENDNLLPESNAIESNPPPFDLTSFAMNDGDVDTHTALVDEFNLNVLDERGVLEPLLDSSDDILRNDVLLSNSVSLGGCNSEDEFQGGQIVGTSSSLEVRLHAVENTDSLHTEVFTPETFVRPKSDEDNVKSEDESGLNISVEDALLQLDKLQAQDIKEEVKEELPEVIEIKQEPVEEEQEDDIILVKEIVKEKKSERKRRSARRQEERSGAVGNLGGSGDNIQVVQQDDLFAKVIKESGLEDLKLESGDQLPEPEKVKSEIVKDEGVSVDEEEILHEELLDVVDAAEFEETLHGSASQVDLGRTYTLQRKGFDSFSLSYQPYFNWHGYRNDHAYTELKTEPAELEAVGWKTEDETSTPSTPITTCEGGASAGSGAARRMRVESESSGYSSEDSRSTRDEKLAEKMGLPYTVFELINCPVDRFNKIINDKDLSPAQAKLCKDIRRRGKNKVAAQNCRKRKLETIEELQVQVESVRRRKEELMAQRQELEAERRRWSNKLERVEQFVLPGLGKNMVEYTLQVVDDRVEVSTRVGGGSGASSRGRSRQ